MSRYVKQGFSSGQSEDDVLGWPNSCLYSDWIDLNQNSNYIQLKNKPEEAVDTWSEIPRNLLALSSYSIAVTDRVLIFNDADVFRTWTVWAVDNNGWEVANFAIWETLYLVKDNWIGNAYTLYSIPVDDALQDSSWTTSLVTTVWTLSIKNNYEWTWATILWDIAYIWFEDKVCRFEPTSANTVTEFDIFGDAIAWVTYTWGYFRVYTKTGKLMLWDWNSTTISESIDLKMPLATIHQIWNIDYVYAWIAWTNIWMYYMSWYTLTPLFKKTYSRQLSLNKYKFDYDWITPVDNYNGNVYWVAEDWDWPAIYEFWSYINWLSNAYSLLGRKSSYWLDYDVIRAVAVQWDYLYYGFYDLTNRGVDKVYIGHWSDYRVAEWTIITNVNPLDNWLYKKTAKYIYFKVSDIDADRTIEVQISIDWGVYSSLWTVNNQPLDNIARLPIQWDLRDFSLKFILATTLTTSTSPKLYYWYAFDYELHDI